MEFKTNDRVYFTRNNLKYSGIIQGYCRYSNQFRIRLDGHWIVLYVDKKDLNIA